MTTKWDSQETISLVEEVPVVQKSHGFTATFARNAAVSVGRLFITALVALVLPAYLTHKLPVETYAAWVLILQMAAYVSYLDFGVQTGVSKFVAEYEAKGDPVGASRRASAGLAIMLAASIVGVGLTLALVWWVPKLFHQMPSSLYRDVRISLAFVGVSLSFGLFCSVFSAIFLGLHRYAIPMAISTLNRILFTSVVCFAVFFHSSLAVMGAAVAGVNIFTGVLQIVAWRKLASRIRISLLSLDYAVLKKVSAYCSILAIWSAAMLCVSGLDVTIVGKYDFDQAGFYAVAVLPTNFMLALLGAALAPFLPTTSALSTQRTPVEMGTLLSRTTRYSALLLFLCGLPLLVATYPILRLWVGPNYALHSMAYLRILVLANILRMLCSPYATMLIATDSQGVAIAGASAEAIVNVACSIYLVKRFGAIGVAYGTLLGSLVSVVMHFSVSMHYTFGKFAISRARLLSLGMLRPAVITIPSVLLLSRWWSSTEPAFTLPLWLTWGGSTILATWFLGVNRDERDRLIHLMKNLMSFSEVSRQNSVPKIKLH
jgi:O-antigen/teichoic acid export membrane protein